MDWFAVNKEKQVKSILQENVAKGEIDLNKLFDDFSTR